VSRFGTTTRTAAAIGIAVLALTGCRGGRMAGADPAPSGRPESTASTASAGSTGATRATESTRADPGPRISGTAGSTTGGSSSGGSSSGGSGAGGSGAGGSGAGGSGAGTPGSIDQELTGLSSVEASIGSDLDAASSAAAQSDGD
jgi:hypothetical protein